MVILLAFGFVGMLECRSSSWGLTGQQDRFGVHSQVSHPVKAPHMAPLVMHYELYLISHWGWHSGIVCVPTLAHRGFETDCNDFFMFALASIAEIPT